MLNEAFMSCFFDVKIFVVRFKALSLDCGKIDLQGYFLEWI